MARTGWPLRCAGWQRQVSTAASAASSRRRKPLLVWRRARATAPVSSSSTRSTTVPSSPRRRERGGWAGAVRSGQATASSLPRLTGPEGNGAGGGGGGRRRGGRLMRGGSGGGDGVTQAAGATPRVCATRHGAGSASGLGLTAFGGGFGFFSSVGEAMKSTNSVIASRGPGICRCCQSAQRIAPCSSNTRERLIRRYTEACGARKENAGAGPASQGWDIEILRGSEFVVEAGVERAAGAGDGGTPLWIVGQRWIGHRRALADIGAAGGQRVELVEQVLDTEIDARLLP